MTRRAYWGLVILIIGLISVGCVLLGQRTTLEPKLLRKPPPGETYSTGNWLHGKWYRAVDRGPETIFIDGKLTYGVIDAEGEELTYEEIEERYNRKLGEGRIVIGDQVIEKYPYSYIAYKMRQTRATRDENGKNIGDKDILLSRYREMLIYHRDSPDVLYRIASLLRDDSPAEAILYAEEALKYVHLYPFHCPEDIHSLLGYAYQHVADYESALVHYKAAVKYIKANPDRQSQVDPLSSPLYHIKRIEEGNPLFRPRDPNFDWDAFEREHPSNLPDPEPEGLIFIYRNDGDILDLADE